MAGPHTYTFSEFHQHTGGDSKSYQKYLRYVANFRANRLAHLQSNPTNADPLLPVSETTEIPKLHALAHSQISPLLAQERANYAADQASAQRAITGYSSALAQFYKPQSQQIMDNTRAQAGTMAATGAALGDTLRAGPTGLGDLSKYLGAAGGNTQAVGGFGSTGAGLLASRVASQIGGVTGEGTAAANTAAFLPTYAASQGLQTLKQTLASLGAQHTKAEASLVNQEPGVFANLYRDFVNQEIQKAVARQSGYDSQISTGARVTNDTAKNARAAANYYTDAKGRSVPKGYSYNGKGQLVKIPSGSSTASGPGSARYSHYQSAVSKANTIAKQLVTAAVRATAHDVQTTDAYGQPTTKTVHSRINNYYGTLHQVIASISPLLGPYMGHGDIVRFAQRIVNGYYKPGQYGRKGTGATPHSERSGSGHPLP